jgi:hypothetical protein
VDVDDTEYLVRELPVSFLRQHADLMAPGAQVDMLGVCVLREGKPIGAAADDIPMRHLAPLLEAIVDLSGLGEGKPPGA